jgi:hypothetical protein
MVKRPKSRAGYHLLTQPEINEIVALIHQGKDINYIEKRTGRSYSTIKRLRDAERTKQVTNVLPRSFEIKEEPETMVMKVEQSNRSLLMDAIVIIAMSIVIGSIIAIVAIRWVYGN